MDDGIMQEFEERVSVANLNVNELLGYEPSAGKVLLYLSMVAALDCADAKDSLEAVESSKDVVENITKLAVSRNMDLGKKGLEFKDPNLPEDEWLDMFLDAQGFLNDLLDSHLKEFGNDTEEDRIFAFNEASNSIVYMCSVLCARCSNFNDAVTYVKDTVPYVYRFITEECTMVPKDSVES